MKIPRVTAVTRRARKRYGLQHHLWSANAVGEQGRVSVLMFSQVLCSARCVPGSFFAFCFLFFFFFHAFVCRKSRSSLSLVNGTQLCFGPMISPWIRVPPM